METAFNQFLLLSAALSFSGFGCATTTTPPPDKHACAETTAAARPSADTNKALVKRSFEDMWTKRDPAAAHKYFAPDLVNHAAIPSAQGAAGMETIVRKLQKAFPDIQITLDSIVADDDLVSARVTFEGTHKDRLEFATPLEATNKHARIAQVHTFRVKDGRIVEAWMVMDKLDLMMQLGQLQKPQ